MYAANCSRRPALTDGVLVMVDPPYRLEIAGLEEGEGPGGGGAGPARPWVGVHFDCCGVYTRIYRNSVGTAYEGRCPKCLRSLRLSVGPDGTDARFFKAE
jgi:hypothetical protein